MVQKQLVWTQRWLWLKKQGFTNKQLLITYQLLNDMRAFTSKKLADSAWRQLQEVTKYQGR